MLNDKQTDELRQVLLQERDRLERKAREGLSFSMNRERTIGRDSIDESMEEEHFSTELRLRDRETFLLSKITGAIERLEKGTIDECEDCSEPIGYRRLIARPVTTLCIDCKEERETEEREEREQVHGDSGGSVGIEADRDNSPVGLGARAPIRE